MRVVESSKISPRTIAVYQNVDTGEVLAADVIPEAFEKLKDLPHLYKWVVEPFSHYPRVSEHHVAAYLLPSDLAVGERVYLTDLIEDRIWFYNHLGKTQRLPSAYATWDGETFQIEWTNRTAPNT
jgi:hypothetical protein